MLQIYKLPMPIGNGIITKQICSSALLWTSYCLRIFKAPLGPMPKGIGIIRKRLVQMIFHTSEFKLHIGPCQWATAQIARTFVLMLQMYKLYLAPCPYATLLQAAKHQFKWYTLKLMLQIYKRPMPIEIYKLYLAHAHEQLYRTQQKHWLV